jgi:hypothetical protein
MAENAIFYRRAHDTAHKRVQNLPIPNRGGRALSIKMMKFVRSAAEMKFELQWPPKNGKLQVGN